MIVVVEPQCRGFEHEEFNAAFLYGYSLAYPEEKIVFFAEIEHINCVKSVFSITGLSLNNLIYKEILIPEKLNISKPKVVFNYFKILKFILNFSSSNNCKNISFLSIYTYNLIPLKILNRFFYKDQFFIHLVMHGTLEFIKKSNFPLFFRKLNKLVFFSKYIGSQDAKINLQSNKYLYERMFKFSLKILGNNNFTYFVMRDDSLLKLNKYIPELTKNFKSIHLPYILTKRNNFIIDKSSKVLTFGTFDKGNILELRKIANYFSLNSNSSLFLNLFVLGGNKDDFLESNEHVNYPLDSFQFTRKALKELFCQIDYFIFLYKEDSYELTTSGAFFDSISQFKPIIFLKNHCFDFYYERHKFGYRCENLDDFFSKIHDLIKLHSVNYDKFILEIDNLHNEISINNNFKKLYFI